MEAANSLAADESILGGGMRPGLRSPEDFEAKSLLNVAARSSLLLGDICRGVSFSAIGFGFVEVSVVNIRAGVLEQTWSASFEISISMPQSEHLIAGKKLIGLTVSAISAFSFLIREVPALKKASIEKSGGRRCPIAGGEDGKQQCWHEARGSSKADVAGRIMCSAGANP